MKTLRIYLSIRNSTPIRKLEQIAKSKHGGVVAENGLMIAGVAALIMVVIGLIITFAGDTFVPALKSKLMEIFSMS